MQPFNEKFTRYSPLWLTHIGKRKPPEGGFRGRDCARIYAVSEAASRRRRNCRPTPPKPMIIIAQVPSSGVPGGGGVKFCWIPISSKSSPRVEICEMKLPLRSVLVMLLKLVAKKSDRPSTEISTPVELVAPPPPGPPAEKVPPIGFPLASKCW